MAQTGSVTVTIWMTRETRSARPCVVTDFIVFVIHVVLIMIVAIGAAEDRVVIRVRVAVRASVPFAFMSA